MNIFEETKNIMRKYNIKANKSLGQNFLINSEVVEKIIESSEISDKDMVIEIGPGLGTLTKYLLEKARKVLCVELDSKMIRILQERFSKYENFELINADILKVDLNEIICENKRTGKIKDVKVVANLPYYITTPILMGLIEKKLPIDRYVTMMQKEVAERLSAKPGSKDYNALSIAVQYYTEAKIALTVPKTVFIPAPNVDSAVVRLTRREQPAVEVINEDFFMEVVHGAFKQRRKTLQNNLNQHFADLTKEEVTAILEEAGILPNRRGESLSIEEFAKLSNTFYQHLNK